MPLCDRVAKDQRYRSQGTGFIATTGPQNKPLRAVSREGSPPRGVEGQLAPLAAQSGCDLDRDHAGGRPQTPRRDQEGAILLQIPDPVLKPGSLLQPRGHTLDLDRHGLEITVDVARGLESAVSIQLGFAPRVGLGENVGPSLSQRYRRVKHDVAVGPALATADVFGERSALFNPRPWGLKGPLQGLGKLPAAVGRAQGFGEPHGVAPSRLPGLIRLKCEEFWRTPKGPTGDRRIDDQHPLKRVLVEFECTDRLIKAHVHRGAAFGPFLGAVIEHRDRSRGQQRRRGRPRQSARIEDPADHRTRWRWGLLRRRRLGSA